MQSECLWIGRGKMRYEKGYNVTLFMDRQAHDLWVDDHERWWRGSFLKGLFLILREICMGRYWKFLCCGGWEITKNFLLWIHWKNRLGKMWWWRGNGWGVRSFCRLLVLPILSFRQVSAQTSRYFNTTLVLPIQLSQIKDNRVLLYFNTTLVLPIPTRCCHREGREYDFNTTLVLPIQQNLLYLLFLRSISILR